MCFKEDFELEFLIHKYYDSTLMIFTFRRILSIIIPIFWKFILHASIQVHITSSFLTLAWEELVFEAHKCIAKPPPK